MLKKMLLYLILVVIGFAMLTNITVARYNTGQARWDSRPLSQFTLDRGARGRSEFTLDPSKVCGIIGDRPPRGRTRAQEVGSPSASSPVDPPFDSDKLLPERETGYSNNEPTIAVNPLKPNNLVAGYHDYATGVPNRCVWTYSFDGGHTWTYGGAPPVTVADDFHSDPVLAADEYGNFYYLYMSIRSDESAADIVVAKSIDGGKTFPTYSIVYSGVAGSTFPDKCWIDVDTWPDSPYKGRIYVTYTLFYYSGGAWHSVIRLHYSATGGASWSSGIDAASSLIAGGEVQGSQPATAPDGTVYVALLDRGTWPASPPYSNGDERITVSRSSDGGWSIDLGPVAATPFHTCTERTGMPPSYFRAESFPFIDIGPEDNVYVTYAHNPGSGTPGVDDDGDIGFTRSTSDGVTWINDWTVNDDTTENDQWWPAIKVEEDDGTIHLIWLDRRLDATDNNYHTYYAYSTDGGITFPGNDVRASTASSDPGTDTFIGDYIDVDASPYRIHPIWTDRRTTNEDIYVSRGWKKPLGIAVISTMPADDSVLKALDELDYAYDHYETPSFPDNYDRYNIIIQAMDGGTEHQIPELAGFIQRGGRAILLGGSRWSPFVNDTNSYLMSVNTTYYDWTTVSGTPDITVVDPDHPLAEDLPSTYDFVTSGASFYMLRIVDPGPHVVAMNGDGYKAIVTEKLGYGRFTWFINSPYDGYWTDPADYDYLKTFLRNALKPADIAVITSTTVDGSVLQILDELGYDYDYYKLLGDVTDFPCDYNSYRVIIQVMNGGTVLEIPWLADYINNGGQAILLGGSNYQPFVLDVDTYLMRVNTTEHGWTGPVGSPDITIVDPDHPWAKDLPLTNDFNNTYASRYMLRIIDPAPHLVAINGDGDKAIVTSRLGYGRFTYFINHGWDYAWSDPGDYSYLKTFLRNVLRPLGDVNHDHYVDQMDLALISEALGTAIGDPGYNPDADLNKDGRIDIDDIILFKDYWTNYLFD